MEMPIPDPGRTDRTLYCDGQGRQRDFKLVSAAVVTFIKGLSGLVAASVSQMV